MKIVFFSSVLNHHQLPFCTELYKELGSNFTFVSTMDIEDQRVKLGYNQFEAPYLLKMHKSDNDYSKAYKLSQESDIMIAGVFPYHFYYERMKRNKVTFRYSERFFKSGRMCMFSPRALYFSFRNNTFYRNKNLYLLCASAYAASDMEFIFSYPNKMFKWGYYPELKEYNIDDLMKKKFSNIVPKFLWVGRFLDWKHPDDAIKVAHFLKKQGFSFIMELVGTGPMEAELYALIKKYQLHDFVHLCGSMPPDDVRKKMENANIFIFTSDYKEGWGVVLNEAMNSACAVVASNAIGAVPFLLKDKINGLTYKSGDTKSFFEKVKLLLDKKDMQIDLGINAYKTIQELWNAKVAANRFLNTAENLLRGKLQFYDNGPMSRS